MSPPVCVGGGGTILCLAKSQTNSSLLVSGPSPWVRVVPLLSRLLAHLYSVGYATPDSDGAERGPTTGTSEYGALLRGTVLSG